jgi:transposase
MTAGDWREERRLYAWKLAQEGWRQKDIAAHLEVSRSAVSQWIARARVSGVSGLRGRTPPGAPRRLRDEQLARLPSLLEKGARHYGFKDDNWTRRRFAQLIERTFGVSYSERHAGRLMKAAGFTGKSNRR